MGDVGARSVDSADADVTQERIVLLRDDPADHHEHFAGAGRLQLFDELRHQCFVTSCLRRHTHHMDIVVHRVASHFGGGLEQGCNVHIETEISKCSGDDLGSSVVPVLAHLGHEHAGTATLLLGEAGHVSHDGLEIGIIVIGSPVYAADAADLR